MINLIKASGGFDELYTPSRGVKPIIPFIPKGSTIWECTDFGESKITSTLKESGFKVISTHLKDSIDFLKDDVLFNYDLIITNPPYSIKDKFLERAFKLNKPFMFLLPINSLEGVNRSKLFKRYGIQILVLNKRLDFSGTNSPYFNTSWFCWGLDLESDLVFLDVT